MAISTVGTTLKYTAGSSATAKTIRVKTVPSVEVKKALIESTDLTDTARTYVAGVRDNPSDGFAFTANFDKTVYSEVRTIEIAGTVCEMEVTYPDGSTIAWSGTMAVSMNESAVNAVQEMTITSIPTTGSTFTAGT